MLPDRKAIGQRARDTRRVPDGCRMKNGKYGDRSIGNNFKRNDERRKNETVWVYDIMRCKEKEKKMKNNNK